MTNKEFARVIIKNTEDKFLGVFSNKYDCWVPPGGMVELNENPMFCVIRESLEELGDLITFNSIQLIESKIFLFKDRVYTSQAVSDAKISWVGHIYFAQIHGVIQNREKNKHKSIDFIAREQIYSLYQDYCLTSVPNSEVQLINA